MAEWGKSKTFVSFLPQPPVPAALIGVRAERANVRAGEHVRVVGFARKRVGTAYRPASGDVRCRCVARGRTLAERRGEARRAPVRSSAELALPADAPAGDAAVLAATGGASGGAAIHIDGVGDVVLVVAARVRLRRARRTPPCR